MQDFELLSNLLDCSDDAIFAIDAGGHILAINVEGARKLGKTVQEVVGQHLTALFLPEEAAALLDDNRQVFESGKPHRFEDVLHLETLLGTKADRTFLASKFPLRDEDGNVVAVCGISRDITENKNAERRLKESEERLRMDQECAQVGTWEWNLATGKLFWSKELERLYGFETGTFPGTYEGFSACIHPEDLARVERIWKGAVATHQPFNLQFRITLFGGKVRWISCQGGASYDDVGNPTRLFGVNADSTARVEAEMTLQAKEQRYQMLFDNMLNGFAHCRMLFDNNKAKDFIYLSVNKAFEAQTGLRDVVGRKVSEVIPGIRQDNPELFDAYARVAGGGPPERFEFHVNAMDMWFDISVFSPRIEEFVAVFDVITERKRAEAAIKSYNASLAEQVAVRTKELLIAKDAAEAATIAKSTFMRTMSHEMNTPLHQISGMAQLIRRDPLTPKQVDRLDKLQTACNRLTGIVGTILAVTDITSGKIDFSVAAIDIRALLTDVASIMQEKAAAKNLDILIEAAPLDAILMGDKAHLNAALLNYLDNAIKFTETGRVNLRSKLVDQNADTMLIRFEVEDTGIGISANDLPRLFSIFEQADGSLTRKFGGIGMGLVMTKKIAQIMGGDAGCESTPGTGSTFWFTVRLKKVQQAAWKTGTGH